VVGALDYIVVVAYFAVMLGAAWWGYRRARTADDYLVAGRRLGYPMFIGTLSAVVLGGASTIGTVSLGYEHGLSGAALVFMIGLGLIGLGVLLSRRLAVAGVYTVPELMAKRYGISARLVSAAIMAAYALMIAVTSTIASGTVFNDLLGVSTTAAIVIAGGVVVLYCVTGGMWSLTLTDIVQFAIMTLGIFALLLPFAVSEAGGFGAMGDKLPASYFEPTSIGASTIFTYFLLFFFGLMIGQDIWQRIFTGRDEKVIRRGTIFAGAYCIVYGIAGALIGAAAKVVLPNLGNPDEAFSAIVEAVLPAGITGLVLAAALAAIMSTASAALLASSTILERPAGARPPGREPCARDARRDARRRRRRSRRFACPQRRRWRADRRLRSAHRRAVRADRARAPVEPRHRPRGRRVDRRLVGRHRGADDHQRSVLERPDHLRAALEPRRVRRREPRGRAGAQAGARRSAGHGMIRTVHHRPPEASAGPRFTGPRTFMRLPHVQTTEDVDLAIVGVPTDDAVSFKSGARFGPEAVRSASVLLRPYNPHLAVDVVERLSMVDYGDAPTVPGYHEETLARIERHLTPLHEAGVTPLCVGGDHSIVLAELRAAARTHGPLAVVHLDAHADVWDEYYGARYFHGTVFKRAVEEGLVDPHRSVQAGMRGTLYGESDERAPGELGYDAITWAELERLTPEQYSDRVRARVGDMPAFLSFDIDFVDPAFAPGTGTPEVGGPTSSQALAYLRSLTGIEFRGFDCVEVSPPYDPSGITAWLAASACHEMISLAALRGGT
jgi:SSS family solute:Na+ symporter